MPSQVLVLKPDAELTFRGPFDRVATSVLRLRNPTADQTVAFKVKTTAPKRYCVRPNSGLVQPDSEVEVAVMLQPTPPAGEQGKAAGAAASEASAKHKFMVQSLVVPAGTQVGTGLDEAWRGAKPESLMDSKLRVVLIEEKSDTATAAASPTAESNATKPRQDQKQQPQQQQHQQKQQLQQELQKLREENARLTDQELRLRKLAMRPDSGGGGVGDSASAMPYTLGASSGQQQQLQQPTLPPALFLVLALVLGLVLGKFLL